MALLDENQKAFNELMAILATHGSLVVPKKSNASPNSTQGNKPDDSPYSGEFKVGDRVMLHTGSSKVEGTVFSYDKSKQRLTVDRDDNERGGSGDHMPQKGYHGWLVVKESGDGGIWTDVCRPINVKKKKKIKGVNVKELERVVLPEADRKEIISVLKQSEHTEKIFKKWGLGDVIEYGRGMNMIFYGGPGTGKTWCAHCIAKAVGRELLVINAANIQSSEPGGANRAIEAAFKEATDKKKVLFLDECDSLITQRNDVGMIMSSEINTLLTQIEKFEGICILATNRIDTLDEALERRLSLILEFKDPDFAARKEIWSKLLPKKFPLASDVSVDKLAEYKLTGGQIKNVVLQTARLTAADGHMKAPMEVFEKSIERVQKAHGLMGKRSSWLQGYDLVRKA